MKNNKIYLTESEIKTSFKKRIRSYIGNYHEKRGVTYFHTSDTKYFEEFERIANTIYKVADAMRYLKITTANAETSVNRIKNAISSAIQPIN